MLDSSPVALPSRRPLKRSASTASLPTPPRTHRKHASGRSRGSCDSDSDEPAVLSSDDEETVDTSRKKRRLAVVDAAANEDAFWLGGTSTSAGLKAPQNDPGVQEGSSRQQMPLIYQRKLQQMQRTESVAPVSPPPSKRRAVKALVPPSTPPRTRSASKKPATVVKRDSPDNPFLDSPLDETAESPPLSSDNPSPDRSEKPYIYMVFRGKRREYPNRLYDHKLDKPLLPPENSELDINHPDYEPSEFCAPRVLFPDARRARRNAPRAAKKRAVSPEPIGDDPFDLDLAADVMPKKLNFGRPKQQQKEKAKALPEKNRKTLEEEFKNAGEALSA